MMELNIITTTMTAPLVVFFLCVCVRRPNMNMSMIVQKGRS